MKKWNFFKELDHTADLCVDIYGNHKPDLFKNAIFTLYILLNLEKALDKDDSPSTDALTVYGLDLEDALVRLLGELLYRSTEDKTVLLPKEVFLERTLLEEKGWQVKVTGSWRHIENEENRNKREIKAVTYHDICIRLTPDGYAARVVMDL